jgi:hypothetical protein
MKFICPKCKKILKKDMRKKIEKYFLTASGNYRSFCEKAGNDVICKKIK